MARIKIEDIQTELAQDNWKVLSKEYLNLETEMVFECSEGHKVYAPWKKIRQKRECPVCSANEFKNQDTKIIPKKKGQSRILALDQATHTTGWAIFDNDKLIKYGNFQTTSDDEIARDHQVKEWLISMIHIWKPDIVGIEGIQFQDTSAQRTMGVTVFETLARLQGILMETCYSQEIQYKICPTNTWRHHCGVKGRTRADKKRSMQLLAKQWYDVTLVDDEADAIGIGKYITEVCTIYSQIQTENWE